MSHRGGDGHDGVQRENRLGAGHERDSGWLDLIVTQEERMIDWLLAILFCFVIFCLFSLFMFVRAVNEDLKEYEYYGFEEDEDDE